MNSYSISKNSPRPFKHFRLSPPNSTRTCLRHLSALQMVLHATKSCQMGPNLGTRRSSFCTISGLTFFTSTGSTVHPSEKSPRTSIATTRPSTTSCKPISSSGTPTGCGISKKRPPCCPFTRSANSESWMQSTVSLPGKAKTNRSAKMSLPTSGARWWLRRS